MIKKLRKKVMGLAVLFVAILLSAVLLSLFFSARNTIAQRSTAQLLSALQFGAEQAEAPCFIAEVLPSGTVRVSGSHYYDLNDHEALSEAVEAAMSSGLRQGVLREQGLRFCRQDGLLTVRIAFMDSSFEQDTLRSLTLIGTLLFVVALAVVAALGWLLAGYITRPVERAWKREKQFLADASHELKTPLTVILSSSALLEETADEEQAAYVENIRAEGQRMKALVEDMLTLWRTEERSPVLAPTSLSEIVTEAALRFEPVAFEAGHPLHYDIENELNVLGEAEKLRRVVNILLDNAVKYAASNTAVRLTLDKVGKQAVLAVENEGVPIPAEKLEHLFDRFYRADESRGEAKGFGLGLAIAREIVHGHRGTITARSDERVTVFTVALPLA
ncbi:MAG: HAMP domain-containing histidine kinase [Oscillospiraceae bacterium]|nr:HAMP domain-containing histidine kinase [Oscillospiraceae bacterium]